MLTPVENARARAEVGAILDSAFSDTTNTWELGPEGDWRRLERKAKKAHSHQEAMMRRARGACPACTRLLRQEAKR